MNNSGRDQVSASAENDPEDDEDLLGGLESLLEEEGVSLDEDEALSEDDLGDIFADGEQEDEEDTEGPAAPAPSAAASRPRRGGGHGTVRRPRYFGKCRRRQSATTCQRGFLGHLGRNAASQSLGSLLPRTRADSRHAGEGRRQHY